MHLVYGVWCVCTCVYRVCVSCVMHAVRYVQSAWCVALPGVEVVALASAVTLVVVTLWVASVDLAAVGVATLVTVDLAAVAAAAVLKLQS